MKPVLSWLWSIGSWVARWVARPERLPCSRVISVGNIQAGGAGKTPLVAMIAREAKARGRVACILCRGYGGEWERRGGLIAPGEPVPSTALCGDEAALLHELAPQAWIGVGADRAKAFRAVVERAGKVDVAILDDGFQHHRLARDVDVVAVTDATRADRLFRDFSGSLQHADLVVFTKGEEFPAAPAGVPTLRARYELPTAPAGIAPLCLVTGLADGAEVQRELERRGYFVAVHLPFRDHAHYDAETVQRILREAGKQGQQVATTGKDWVKWRELGVEGSREPRLGQVLVLEPTIRLESPGSIPTEAMLSWNRIVWSDPSR